MEKAKWRGRRPKKLAIAFYCWAKGYFEKGNAERLAEIPDSPKLADQEAVTTVLNEATGEWGVRVQRGSLPGYATDDFWEAVQMWNDWKEFGFPDSGGKEDQPCLWVDVIRLFNRCAKRMGVL